MKIVMDWLRLGIIVCLIWIAAAQSNEGTEFAVVCTPCYHGEDCELILSARQTTNVTITTESATEVVTVYRNWTLHYPVDYAMRPETEIEDKGIYLSSNEPIVVHITVGRIHDNHTPDTALARPYTDSATEYFLASYDDMISSAFRPTAFYVIVATEDDTEVDVFYAETDDALPDEHLTLDRYEVFTRDCYMLPDTPEIDFTGTRIVSSKPVSVFGGNGQAYLFATGANTASRHLMDSMPATSELGTEYITFPMLFGGDGGYEVRVIAVADDTDITVPAFSTSLTLNAGKFYVIDNTETLFGFRVSCSKPCMVMHYIRSLPAGGPMGLDMSAFMATLVPEERVSSHLIFSVPSIMDQSSYDIVAALSVIVNTSPVTDLFLNDTRLDSLSWVTVSNSSSCYATMEIQSGFYQLYSTRPLQKFTAYMYLLRNTSGVSYPAFGAAIGYGDLQPITTPTPPEEAPPTPLYRILLLGNFTSSNGEEFDDECTDGLRGNFFAKAAGMIPDLNDMFGFDLCSYVQEESVAIISLSSIMETNGTSGGLDLSYLLEADVEVTIANFTSCAEELSVYLQDFDTWGRPVVPPVHGCPEPDFDPDFFFETLDGDGNVWVCRSAFGEEIAVDEVDAPLHSLSVYDNFTTVDDENLDAQCIQRYQLAWQVEANEMVSTLNSEIDGGQLCPGEADKFSVTSSLTSLSPNGNKGSITATFMMTLTDDDLRFYDVNECVDEIFFFLNDHGNWGNIPVVPGQPGCPGLVFEPPYFYHSGQAWHCL